MDIGSYCPRLPREVVEPLGDFQEKGRCSLSDKV